MKSKLAKEGVKYIIFGILTTIINIGIFGLLKFLGVQYILNNIIAFLVSVAFAFITNKLYVFNSKSLDKKLLLEEAVKFMASRVGTFLLETGIMLVLVELFKINEFTSKCTVAVIVFIGNYILSKFMVFRKVN